MYPMLPIVNKQCILYALYYHIPLKNLNKPNSNCFPLVHYL